MQAAISALHAAAPEASATDWQQIAALYDTLASMTASLVVEVNRAVAVAMAWGAQAGLQMLDRLDGELPVGSYYPYHAARADLLRRMNRPGPAADAYRACVGPVRQRRRSRLSSASARRDAGALCCKARFYALLTHYGLREPGQGV